MALELYRIQFSVPLYGDATQTASNTWYFQGIPGPSESDDLIEAFDRLTDFYLAIDGPVFPAAVVGTAGVFLAYRMSDAEPRVPIGDRDVTLVPGAGGAYPSDVAICLSYHAQYTSGVNRARRRGRVFLGPVLASTAVAVAGQGQRVSPTIVSTVLGAAQALNVLLSTALIWAVYSPTDNLAWAIEQASVDNGFDTRRSRDNRATTRTSVFV